MQKCIYYVNNINYMCMYFSIIKIINNLFIFIK